MMLESLFAHAGQGRVFLVLTVCGMALAAFVQCTAFLRRVRGLSLMLDGLTGVMLLGMLLVVLLRYEGGVRAYGVLGLIIGALLYLAGLAQPIRALTAFARKLFDQSGKSMQTEAGIRGRDGELLSQESQHAAKE